jgi:hypothetical protein
MNSCRASFGALPRQMSGGLTNPEENIINSMESDDGESQFNADIFQSPGSELAGIKSPNKLAALPLLHSGVGNAEYRWSRPG